MLTSRIRNTNTDGKPFTFTFSYQTYFAVSDIRFYDKIYLLYESFESLLLSVFWVPDHHGRHSLCISNT